ncbi:MAG: hypothetical protein GY791_00320 [Alphaproteobacteria bacterium]|nr:hypothetical protein [Alphaproteobacteria bacterium]
MTKHAVLERIGEVEEIAGSSDRGFGIVFTVVFAIVGVWPLVFGDGGLNWWAFIVAAAILAVALSRPALLAPANRLWTRLSILLSRVVNPIVMGLIYFVMITPIAICMRLAGRDSLRLKPDSGAHSYWIKRDPPGPEPETMADQF